MRRVQSHSKDFLLLLKTFVDELKGFEKKKLFKAFTCVYTFSYTPKLDTNMIIKQKG